jgi:protein-glucosylgalactosylhydroxylysine glucosidase
MPFLRFSPTMIPHHWTSARAILRDSIWYVAFESFLSCFCVFVNNESMIVLALQPLMGNGYLSHAKGVRSDTMYVSGVYNGETTSPSHRAALPATLAVTVENSHVLGVLLDVETGTYHRRGHIDNSTANYELRWYAHRSLRGLYVMELDVFFSDHDNEEDNKEETSVTLTLSTNTLDSTPDFVDVPVTDTITSTLSKRNTDNGSRSSVDITCRTTKIAETAGGETPTVCVVSDRVPSTLVVTRTTTATDNNSKNNEKYSGINSKHHSSQRRSVSFTFLSATRTSLDVSAAEAGVEAVAQAAVVDYTAATALAQQPREIQEHQQQEESQQSKLHALHAAEWANLWASGITIGGRPDVSAAVNASLYAIYSSVRDDWPYGLAPGGLTNYYNGHSFWDTESWMYPSLLLLQPPIARSLIQYRFDRLDGARMKAQSYSPPWAGTMFPWESAFSGVETCPTFAATGLREDHISGDIALAVWQEWCMRMDATWLRTVGYPILSGVAGESSFTHSLASLSVSISVLLLVLIVLLCYGFYVQTSGSRGLCTKQTATAERSRHTFMRSFLPTSTSTTSRTPPTPTSWLPSPCDWPPWQRRC